MSTFIDAIIEYGYSAPREVIADGKIKRFATDANKRHSKDGWYIYFDGATGKAGVFGSWRDGNKVFWSNGTGRQFNEQEMAEIERQRKAAFEEAKREKIEAAQRAQRLYNSASELGESEYLRKKGIDRPEGARFVENIPASAFGFKRDAVISALLIPVYAPSGVIATLQIIEHDGNKLFMPKGSTSGGWFSVGDWQSAKCVVIAEGVATMQSVYQASGFPAVAAFSAGNLESVARMVRSKNAIAEILIATDGDKAGRNGAAKAVAAVSARSIEAPDGMDWNDVHTADGIGAVRQAFVTEEMDTLWKSDLIVKNKADGTQNLVKCVSNFSMILANDPEWRNGLSFDSFLCKIISLKDLPIDIKKGDEFKPHSMTRTRMWLEMNHYRDNLPKLVVDEAIVSVAMQNESHQVKEYLNQLKWDGVPRIDTFLHRATSCEDDAYSQAVSLSLFISAVNRIYMPGSQVDTVVVLEGSQGLRKSTLLKTLFTKRWCAAITSDFRDKDFYQNLRGKWCMVFDDLHRMKSNDQNTMKQIISADSDTYRASYAAASQDWPRQNIFAATTNDHQYLDDPTGARRFLPIVCKKIDIDWVDQNRDQLWAEAVARMNNAGEWWDIPEASDHQDQRQEVDPWYSIIQDYVAEKQNGNKSFSKKHVDIFPEDIMYNCLAIKTSDMNKSQRNRVVSILTRLGYKMCVGKTPDRKSYRCYRLDDG